MANTKTKTLTASAVALAAEEQALAAVAQAEAAAAEAAARVEKLEAAAQIAAERVEEIEDAWASGDDSEDGMAMATAQAEVTRVEALLAAARGAQARQKRAAAANVDKSLAEIVADVLASMLPNEHVEIVPTFVRPQSGQPKLVAHIWQEKRAESIPGGAVSGHVEIHYTRHPMFAPLTASTIERAAERAGIRVEGMPGGSTHEDGVNVVDTVRLRLPFAHAAVPVIPSDPTEHTAREAVESFAAEARTFAGGLTTRVSDARVNVETNAEGLRTTTVHGHITTKQTAARKGGSYFEQFAGPVKTIGSRDALERAAETWAGTFVRFMGVGVEAEVSAAPGSIQRDNGFTWQVRLTATSRKS